MTTGRGRAIHTRRRQSKKSPVSKAVLLVIVAVLVIGFGSWGIRSLIDANNQARLDRIEEIYTSLKLEDDYAVTGQELFGERHPYEGDSKKSHASWTTYVHSGTVTNTFNDLDAKIQAAGYEYVGKPADRAVDKQAFYKSKKGEYVRLTVASKPFADAFQNATAMDKEVLESLTNEYDVDAGPSNVTISINLDDNNQ